MLIEELSGGCGPTQARHGEVSQDDVRAGLFDDGQQFVAVGGFADDFDFWGPGERCCQSVPEHGVVVGDDDADRRCGGHGCARGRVAVTVVPCATESMMQEPWRASVRARIEVSPTPVEPVVAPPPPSSATVSRRS
jgi:hypothetical protein